MWQIKYTPGAKPGKRKAEQSDKLDDKTAKVAKRNEYEKNKRPERTFNASWKQGRPWLTYDEKTNDMKCSVCIEFGKTDC